MKNRLAPLVGPVVWAWMPQSETVLQPGPKLRPVLVLEAGDASLLVAYGTSQKTDRFGRGELIATPSEMSGLPKTTKFSLQKTLRLPASHDYFAVDGKVGLVGRLPQSALGDLKRAMIEMGWLE